MNPLTQMSNGLRVYRQYGTKGVYDGFRAKIKRAIFRRHETTVAISRFAVRLDIRDFEAELWYGKYRYEFIVWPQLEFDWMLRNVSEDDIILDGGGHQGLWSIVFARLAPRGEVHMFETSRHNHTVAASNMKLNGVTRVAINNCALGDREGSVNVTDDSGGVASGPQRRRLHLTVPVTSGDAYFTQLGRWPTLIKIDVEGYELEVLDGLKHSLDRTPKIMLELSNFKFKNDSRGYVEAALSKIPLQSYFGSYHVEPGNDMIYFDRLTPEDLRRIAAANNPHIYFIPRDAS